MMAEAQTQTAKHGAGGAAEFPTSFNVRHFGAKGDGVTVDSPAINKAIDAAAAVGGGTVVFPAGNYLSFSIRLKSHVHLYLSQGCTIIAAASPLPGETTGYQGGTYDAAEPNTEWDAYQDYGHNHWHNSLIWGEGISDVGITGPGVIYGKGLSFGAGPGRPPGHAGPGFGPERPAAAAGTTAATAAPARPRRAPQPRGDYPMYQAEQAGVGNKAIALKNCHNVIFRDFAILKGGHFGLLLTGVDNLTIDNLTIDTDRDGMDIDCCKNVRVSNCAVNSPWDDAIVPKSSYALGYIRPCINMVISNCYVTGTYELGTMLDGTWKKFAPGAHMFGTGRIKFGTESNGGFQNVTVTNCVFEGCQGLAFESDDGAILEDMTVSNITMRDIISAPIFMRLGSRLRGPKETTKVGAVRRIIISNIVSSNASSHLGCVISGIPGYPIENIRISNMYLEHKGGGTKEQAALVPPEKEEGYPEPGMFGDMPSSAFFLRHVKNIDISDVQIVATAPDQRPAFNLLDVDGADIYRVRTKEEAGVPKFVLNNVSNFSVGRTPGVKDTEIAKTEHETL